MFRKDLVSSMNRSEVTARVSPCLPVCPLLGYLLLLVSRRVSSSCLLVARRGTLEMAVWRIRIAALHHRGVTVDHPRVSLREGHDFYFTPLPPSLVGKTFCDATRAFDGATVLGIEERG